MKVPNPRADAFVGEPPKALRAALLYGGDAGLVKERAERLVRRLVPADPAREAFHRVILSGAELSDDPARLADEAAAFSLLAGPRVVQVRGAQESHAEIIARTLAGPLAADLIVIEAGGLRKSSPLVRLFEAGGAERAAIACYADDDRQLRSLITETLGGAGLSVDGDALAYLESVLGADRLVTRAELAKLIAYMGEERRVRRGDAEAAVGDSGAVTAESAAVAAVSGDLGDLERALSRAAAEGIAPTTLVRVASAHLERLMRAAARVALGESPAAAIKRQGLHFRLAEAMAGQLRRWPPERAGVAYERLLDAEIAIKSTAAPARAIAERALLNIAGAARRGHSAPPSRRRISSS